jgi:thiol-disulfide isomerase/thioredoxin
MAETGDRSTPTRDGSTPTRDGSTPLGDEPVSTSEELAVNRRDVLAGVASLGVVGGGAVVARRRRGTGANAPAVVDFFATWCSDCASHLSTLVGLAERLPADVQLVSVTTEQVGTAVTRDSVARWFAGERRPGQFAIDPSDPVGGHWPVALDPELVLAARVGATRVPYTAVFDAMGRLGWAAGGLHTVAELESVVTATTRAES